jgi:para-nitrobenzyl esterase
MIGLLLMLLAVTSASDLLQTTLGTVRGYTANGVQYFRGIPFAAPPIGKNRFRPPQPATPWSGVRDALASDVMCPQGHSLGPFMIGDEDCLYLDVYRPANTTAGAGLSITVWLYGGGWVFGDKLELGLYDATNMVNIGGHVHVAMNYRLGVFGFMAHPDLMKESGTTGNYGLQDQVAALKWVQANAYQLGGDPTRVTIFGESAGAFSVCWHLVSPSSKGLFSAAIGESGDCDAGPFFRPLPLAVNFSVGYANSVGCAGPKLISCLRQLTADALFDGDLYGPPLLAPLMPWAAAIDRSPIGLADVPLTLMKQNSSLLNRVPYMTGTNNNEGSIFVAALPLKGFLLPLFKSSYEALLLTIFRNQTLVDTVIGLYDHEATYEDSVSAIFRDWFFACPTRQTAAAWHRVVQQPVYLYHWAFLPDNWVEFDVLGDYHAAELFMVFRNGLIPYFHKFDQRDTDMSYTVQNYWLSFAFTHSPNAHVVSSAATIAWPQYNTTSRTNIRLDNPLLLEDDYRADVCATFFDNLPPFF